MKNTTKGVLGAGVLGGAGAGYMFPQETQEVLSTTAEQATNVIGNIGGAAETGTNIVANTVGSPAFSAAAPFAAPMVAGGYLGKKLADITKIEGKWKRRIMTATGAGIGAGMVVAGSAATPFLVGGAAAVALAKPALWTAGKLGRGASGIYGGVGGAIGHILKTPMALGHGAKNGYQNPSVIPNIQPA